MIARLAVVGAAVLLAVVPLPPAMVEGWYSRGFYPRLQAMVTPVSNLVPIAVLDVALGVVLLAFIALFVRTAGWRAKLLRTAAAVVTTAAIVYIAFVAMWGLNYRRQRVEDKVAYDRSRVDKAAVSKLANQAIAQANTLYAPAHATPFDARRLEASVREAQQRLGDSRTFVAGVPKRSLLSWYFRQAAISGMTDPVFLEIILNDDLLLVERPMVLAHEWAHLAGYAHEAEANFVAWLACLRGDALARYSAALSTYAHAASALPPPDRRQLTRLEAGPREDLRAIAARYERSRPAVRRVAADVYDSYLKANRVEEGIASYDAVLRLMLGTEFVADGVPKLRF